MHITVCQVPDLHLLGFELAAEGLQTGGKLSRIMRLDSSHKDSQALVSLNLVRRHLGRIQAIFVGRCLMGAPESTIIVGLTRFSTPIPFYLL